MSHISKISVKIGCDDSQTEENSEHIDVTATINEVKLNEYSRSIQKQLGMKKTPILTIQFHETQATNIPQHAKLFGYEFDLKTKMIGQKRILYGDIKAQQSLLFLKKVQRIMNSITQLQTTLNIRITSYNIEDKSIKKPIMNIFEKIKIQGTLRMDDKTPEVIKKCIIKVSPKFIQSPIFIFIQMFAQLNWKLDLYSLTDLQEGSAQKLLATLFTLEPHNQDLSNIMLVNNKNSIKITFCLEKLVCFQFVGAANLIASLCQFL